MSAIQTWTLVLETLEDPKVSPDGTLKPTQATQLILIRPKTQRCGLGKDREKIKNGIAAATEL